ncbi:MAG: DNA mismatch repair protein MutS, partial [Blastocatellia bacterium]
MENATPMLRQYLDIKKSHPDALLFFRLGDFYELFDEDAIIGSRELGITLTARQKDSARPIPMCGVPYHSASGYIAKLVKRGYRVAICEQAEPAGKSTKLVRREVVRVITPGTAVDSQLIADREACILAAIFRERECFGLAFLDVSTGDFFATEIAAADGKRTVREIVDNFSPRELLFSSHLDAFIA